ncbi:MAG: GIY-YIG nuclease family protein [Bacteroidales bacterium]|nr:GIY-YIG nuclease family protein [Bacteroidales bacterium]
MFFVYILYSNKRDRYYIGYTSEIENRVAKHNVGSTTSTKSGIPWVLVYKEEFESKTDAIKREKEIKRMKSRKYIERLIKMN